MAYTVTVSRQVLRDIEEAVFYKRGLGAYPDTIERFVADLERLLYESLAESPMIGTSLSYRLAVRTSIRYQRADDHILFYDVRKEDKQVDVLRLLPAKTNWMHTILNYL